MTVLLVGEKCPCTPSTLRFFASLRLVLEQNCLFLDGHKLVVLCYQKEAGDLFLQPFFGGEKCLAAGDIIPAGGVLAFFLVL